MSRIIRVQNGYRIREKALRLIGSAIYEAEATNDNAYYIELASFIALSLEEIESSVRETSDAWEKRDYWVKADQFRSEWGWVGEVKSCLTEAIQQQNRQKVKEVFETLRKKKRILEGLVNPKKGVDYSGSYERLKSKLR